MIKNIVLIIVFIFVIFAYVRYVEKKSIFIPSYAIEFTPSDMNLQYEDVYFKTPDGHILNGWLIPAQDAKYTLLFFHGNGGNICHRLEKIAMFNKLKLNAFIIDYRGYGKSSGSPSEAGIYRDAGASYDYLLLNKQIPQDTIIIYGESLGSAVAIDLASRKKAAALIVDSGFTSARDMSRAVFPLLPTIFLSTRFDSLPKIKKISIPKLIIHSINDEIVPFKFGKNLFDEASQPKELLKIHGSHNTGFMDSSEEFVKGIGSFIEKL